ncbi:LuxR C-terminal-related transcriptional regulator [Streptomyces sp. NPDC057271]|uniref:LuxR C-terminal-related transcriptional regulator n=1 Tax=unclassified Streptomyces TaxID=2593676 RepID=UPI0036292136
MDLSDRQRRILWLRAQGLSGPQIARHEHIAVSTVDWHERVIRHQCKALNIAHAVHLAGMAGLIGQRPDCGDRAAYLRHLRRREDPCLACRAANARHEADRRAGRLATNPKEQAA